MSADHLRNVCGTTAESLHTRSLHMRVRKGREGKGREGITTSCLVTFRNARLSTGRASATDAGPTRATRMMPGGAR